MWPDFAGDGDEEEDQDAGRGSIGLRRGVDARSDSRDYVPADQLTETIIEEEEEEIELN